MAMAKEERNKVSVVNGSKNTCSLSSAVNLSCSVSTKFIWKTELEGFISYITVKTLRLYISLTHFVVF
jgi:hypothetical protein